MKHRIYSWVILILALVTLSLSSCSNHPCERNARLSFDQAQQDLNELRNHILRKHPMNFTSRQDVVRSFDEQYALLKDSMTVMEFYRVIAPAVADVRCGHTRLSFPDCIQEDLYHNGVTLPFDVQVVRDTLVVLESHAKNQELASGAILLSINGQSATDIIAQIKNSLHTDGINEQYKFFQINQHFNRHYLKVIGESNEFDIEYSVLPSGETYQATVGAMTLAEIAGAGNSEHNNDSDYPWLETSIDTADSYAILRIWFFAYVDDIDEVADPIDSFFQDVANHKIETLILDLRENDGGNPYCSAYLLGYLIGEPFEYFTPNSAYMYDDLKHIQAIPERPFMGELYVLVDGGSYSTTCHFLSLLRHHNRGLFIGEVTGGSYMCNAGFREHRLTHSGIDLLLPHVPFIAAADGLVAGQGIIPDVSVGPSVDDVVNDRDPVKDTAITLVRGRI